MLGQELRRLITWSERHRRLLARVLIAFVLSAIVDVVCAALMWSVESGLKGTAKAKADTDQLFPDGRPAAEQLVFVIEAEGESVGDLWLAKRDDMSGRPCLFVYDVHVDEARQGRGFGKAAMLFAEEEARRHGVDRVALNVFGRNEVARRLYQSLGYEENAVAMSKTL
jgi:GNAT superfamily N-acetyltransferase